jgi:hypothetical protein
VSPATGMEIGASVVRLQTSRTVVHLRHRCARRSPTTIDAPMEARTPTPTPMHRYFSTAMLLRGCSEPATSEERRVRQQLKALLEVTAAQQAESSASHQRSERGRAGAPSAYSLNPPPS